MYYWIIKTFAQIYIGNYQGANSTTVSNNASVVKQVALCLMKTKLYFSTLINALCSLLQRWRCMYIVVNSEVVGLTPGCLYEEREICLMKISISYLWIQYTKLTNVSWKLRPKRPLEKSSMSPTFHTIHHFFKTMEKQNEKSGANFLSLR
jgi:hypothetical protein